VTTLNRLHNCTNPNQGKATKVLCLCSAGLLRSPTLANVLTRYGYNTRAAGVTAEYALVPVDEVLVQWADKIVCVEPYVKQVLLRDFPGAEYKTTSLDIPDRFAYMHPSLVEEIEDQIHESKLGEFLNDHS